ncbi:MAG: hypothetical protein QNL43_00680 [Crocinitomicaceae bacterium]|jgi:hypothetical protein
MRFVAFVFLFFLFLLTSCGGEDEHKTSPQFPSIKTNQREVVFLSIDTIQFENWTTTHNGLLDGVEMQQAQSKNEWQEASKNKQPAWCYIDPMHSKGVLYNGYFIKRLGFQNRHWLTDSVSRVFPKNTHAKIKVIGTAQELYTTERNANGNFYNLGFHSFWVFPNRDFEEFNSLSVEHFSGKVKLRSSNPGNGYFIRFLK